MIDPAPACTSSANGLPQMSTQIMELVDLDTINFTYQRYSSCIVLSSMFEETEATFPDGFRLVSCSLPI